MTNLYTKNGIKQSLSKASLGTDNVSLVSSKKVGKLKYSSLGIRLLSDISELLTPVHNRDNCPMCFLTWIWPVIWEYVLTSTLPEFWLVRCLKCRRNCKWPSTPDVEQILTRDDSLCVRLVGCQVVSIMWSSVIWNARILIELNPVSLEMQSDVEDSPRY